MDTLRNVLIVEDDALIRETLIELLVDEGYAVHSATNGQEALALLESSDPLPSVALVDLMMPIMNGTDLIGAMRANPRYDGIACIVISASPTRDAPAGVITVRKPFDIEHILTLIRDAVQPPS